MAVVSGLNLSELLLSNLLTVVIHKASEYTLGSVGSVGSVGSMGSVGSVGWCG